MNDWPKFVTGNTSEFYHFAQEWGLLDYVTGQSGAKDPRLTEINQRVECVDYERTELAS
jgi:hypothetical protein